MAATSRTKTTRARRARDEPEPHREPMRRRLARWRREHPRGALIALVLLVLVVAVAIVVWWYLHTHESTDDAQIDGHIAPVSSRVSGTVTGVFVEDNQPVQVGQLLVQLDPRDFEVALARAQAGLAQARAQLEAQSPTVPITATSNVTQIATTGSEVDTVRAAITAAERDYQSQLAHVRAAEANDARSTADLARYKYLLAQRAIPQERYDQIVATAKATHADADAARAVARAAQKTVEQQRMRLQQAREPSRRGQSQRAAAASHSRGQPRRRSAPSCRRPQAAVERAQLDLSYTKIVAPVAGVVGRRSVEPGQHVQPGEALVAVVALDSLWVTANFKETQLRRMRAGPAGAHPRRRARRQARRQRREHRRRVGRALQPAAAGERHRQLRQGRAADAGAHPLHAATRIRTACCGPACRSSRRSRCGERGGAATMSWRPRHNPWAIALTVTLATFMEVLDTSIANVSLPHIAGNLSVGVDESTWVLTSYLVSNAIVLPVSGWLVDA